jgi:hypothetical protein
VAGSNLEFVAYHKLSESHMKAFGMWPEVLATIGVSPAVGRHEQLAKFVLLSSVRA